MLSRFRLVLTLLFVVGLAAPQGWSQDGKNDPIVERMKKDIFFLASEECEGRGVGTQGLDLAAEYIAAQFRKAGLKPGGINGTYFQPFPYATGAVADGESTLSLTNPEGKKITLKQCVDFQVIGTSAPGKVSAPLVFAGYGVTARGIDYDDYKNLDAKGKAVVALRRVPRWTDKERPFDGANKGDLETLETKQNNGERNRAAAVILVNDSTELPKDNLTVLAVTKGLSTLSTPYVHIKRAAIEDAIKSSTGKSLADLEKAIDEDLKPQSAVLKGWSVDLEVKIKRKEVMVRNVIGYLDGAGPLADEIVVIGGHYDHVGYGAFGSLGGVAAKGKIHFGADDNASGSTTVIELARRFAAIKERKGRKLVFMTFTAEESGLVGSRHYCKVAPLFPLKNTVAMFNLDMVGRVSPRIVKIDDKTVTVTYEEGKKTKTYELADACKFYRVGKTSKEEIKEGLQAKEFEKVPAKGLSAVLTTDAKNKVTSVHLKPELHVLGVDSSKGFDDLVKKSNPGFEVYYDRSVFGASDHFSFYAQKIPVLFLFTGLHQEYHRPTDIPEKIDLAGMKRVADFSERIIDHWRTDPKRPEFASTQPKFDPKGGGTSASGVRIGFLPDMDFAGKGVRVAGISKEGPAEKAGIKTGDIIIALAGKEVANLVEYQKVRLTLKSDVAVEFRVLRNDKELVLKVTPK